MQGGIVLPVAFGRCLRCRSNPDSNRPNIILRVTSMESILDLPLYGTPVEKLVSLTSSPGM